MATPAEHSAIGGWDGNIHPRGCFYHQIIARFARLVERNGNELWVTGGREFHAARLQRYISQQFLTWAEAEAERLCQHIAHPIPPAIGLQEMASRWGSCSPHRNHIRLHWRLSMAPPAISIMCLRMRSRICVIRIMARNSGS